MKTKCTLIVIGYLLSATSVPVFAQDTAFTYQGRLNANGASASGTYNLTFSLFTVSAGGSAVVGPVTTNGVLVTNGLFTVRLDFGPGVFTGTNYWLEVGVETNGAGSFTTLAPRQPITPTPYAVFAEGADAAGISGTIPAGNVGGTYGNAVNFNNGANSFDGSFYGDFYGATFTGGNFVGNFVGTGSSLTDVWHTGGNFGTTAGADFAGTTDNQPLELHVNNQRALRLEPDNTTNVAPNFIAGSPYNALANGIVGASIGGGGASIASNLVLGSFNTIGGGWGNVTGSTNFNTFQATVGGGANNTASGISSTIAGGSANLAYNNDAAIAGGFQNRAGYRAAVTGGNLNTADGDYSGIGGGYENAVATNAGGSFVGGGYGNRVSFPGGSFGGGNATIGGGYYNVTAGNDATVAGGGNNNAANVNATVGGGGGNQASGYSASVAGGVDNIASGDESFVGGGGSDGGQTTLIGNHAFGQFSVIGGGKQNTVDSNATGSVIGGGENNDIQIFSPAATIAGGTFNVIQTTNDASTIGGGTENQIQSTYVNALIANTIAGGLANIIQSNTLYATIGGGQFNTNSGYSATIPGGDGNYAAGSLSFAAGYHAQALYNGDFVWADSQNTNFAATTSDQVSFRCQGGVRFTSGGAAVNQTVAWTPGSGSWTFTSDRNAKEDFTPVDVQVVLEKVAQLPLSEWNYKGYTDRHIGPMAQDFHAAFPFNPDDKMLNSADEAGVELAAIQGLNRKLEAGTQDSEARISKLEAENAELKQRLEALERAFLEQKTKE